MSIKSTIVESIAAMRVIDICYKGSWRAVEPHLLGINSKGNVCLSAFQIEGGSGYSWRSFLVNEISHVNVRDVEFELRAGYNPNDLTMTSILASV